MNIRFSFSRTVFALALLELSFSIANADTIRVPQDVSTISEAVGKAVPGDTVLVSPGTYFESIQLKPKVILKSAGVDSIGSLGLKRAEKTIIDGGKVKGESIVAMAEGSILDGFTIRNLGQYDDKKWKSHHATQGNNQPHEHIGQPSRAPVFVPCETCEVRNNIVHHNGYSGIVISGKKAKGSRPLVTSNVCFRNMGAGISAMLETRAVISHNRCFENFYAGIGQNNASPHIHKNICYQNIRAGIGISNGSCPLVENNKCFQNRRAGIGSRTGDKTQPTIRNNDCYENDMAGIGSEEDAAPVIIENRCYKNRLAGIGCRLHASPTIIANHCFENGKAGIGNDGDSTPLIINNVCERNTTSGIGFAPCQKGNARVLNNRIIDNKLVAIGIHPGWTVYAAGNRLSRKGGMPPLVMIFKGAKARFVDNELKGGGVAGIRCAGEATISLSRIEGEAIRQRGPPNFGVWALPGSKVVCDENTFVNWRHAVSGSDAAVQVLGCKVLNYSSFAFVILKPRQGSRITDNVVTEQGNKSEFYKTDQADRLIVSGNRTIRLQNRKTR